MKGSILVAGLAGNVEKGMVTGLENYGYKVFAAESGDDASGLVKVKKGLVAIVINASLKGLSTIDLCKEIKHVARHIKVPVLILEDVKIDRKLFTDIGIDQFFPLPYTTATVVRAIKFLTDENGPFGGKPPNLKRQLVLAGIILAIGFGLLTFFIFIPLFMGGPKQTPLLTGF